MPLAQAHPFEPMPVTHEEEMQEVSQGERERDNVCFTTGRLLRRYDLIRVAASSHVSQPRVRKLRIRHRFVRSPARLVLWEPRDTYDLLYSLL